MTYKEREKQYCLECGHYNDCAWPKAGRFSNCINGQTFMSGWEQGQKDALEEIMKADNEGGLKKLIETLNEFLK